MHREHVALLHQSLLLELHGPYNQPILGQLLVQHPVQLAGSDQVLVELHDGLDASSLERIGYMLAAERGPLRHERVELERQRGQVHAYRVELQLHPLALEQVVCNVGELDPADGEREDRVACGVFVSYVVSVHMMLLC